MYNREETDQKRTPVMAQSGGVQLDMCRTEDTNASVMRQRQKVSHHTLESEKRNRETDRNS